MKNIFLVLLFLCVVFFLTNANIAIARDAGSGASVFEEIVVTARKREESLEDIPVALTAFTEEDFANNMGDLYDVGKNVPNLFIGNLQRQPESYQRVHARRRHPGPLRLIRRFCILTAFTWVARSVQT